MSDEKKPRPEVISFRVTRDEKRELKRLAKKRRIALDTLVRELVNKKCGECELLVDSAENGR